MVNPLEFQGWWAAGFGDTSTWPNLGITGASLDLTVTNFTKQVGLFGSEYFNDDDSILTNRLTVTDNTTLDVGANEDFVLTWVGYVSSFPGTTRQLFDHGSGITMQLRVDSSGDVDLRINDGVTDINTLNYQMVINTPIAIVGGLRRGTKSLFLRVYDSTGLLFSDDSDASSIVNITKIGDLYFMSGLDGGISTVGFYKGFGITPDEEGLTALGHYLIGLDHNDIFLNTHIDPDFTVKNKLVQPETQRVRAAYRSPLSSEVLNFQYNSTVNDITYLYTKIDELTTDTKDIFNKLYDSAPPAVRDERVLTSLKDYEAALRLLRSQIQKLK